MGIKIEIFADSGTAAGQELADLLGSLSQMFKSLYAPKMTEGLATAEAIAKAAPIGVDPAAEDEAESTDATTGKRRRRTKAEMEAAKIAAENPTVTTAAAPSTNQIPESSSESAETIAGSAEALGQSEDFAAIRTRNQNTILTWMTKEPASARKEIADELTANGVKRLSELPDEAHAKIAMTLVPEKYRPVAA